MARYLGILAGLFAIVPLTALGVWLTWPWLFAESYRLTTLQLVLTNTAEVAAMVWLFYFAIRFAITEDLDSAFSDTPVRNTSGQIIGMVVALAFVVDLSSTFIFQTYDSRRRAEAKPGICEITRVRKFSQEGVTVGRQGGGATTKLVFTAFTWCELIDQHGRRTPVYYFGKWNRFPPSAREPILMDDMPVQMDALYDPEFPYRFWLKNVTKDRWNGWRFSQEVTIWALIFSFVMLVLNRTILTSEVPLEICPAIGIMLRFLLAGIDMLFNGQTSLPPF